MPASNAERMREQHDMMKSIEMQMGQNPGVFPSDDVLAGWCNATLKHLGEVLPTHREGFRESWLRNSSDDDFIRELCASKLGGYPTIVMKRMRAIAKSAAEVLQMPVTENISEMLAIIFDIKSDSREFNILRRHVSLALPYVLEELRQRKKAEGGRIEGAKQTKVEAILAGSGAEAVQGPAPTDYETEKSPVKGGAHEEEKRFLLRLKERRIRGAEIPAGLKRVCQSLLESDVSFFPAANVLQEKILETYGIRTRYITLIKYLEEDLKKWQKEWLDGKADGAPGATNETTANGLSRRDTYFLAELTKGHIKGAASFAGLIEKRLEGILLDAMEKNPKLRHAQEFAKALGLCEKTFRKYCGPNFRELMEMREKYAHLVASRNASTATPALAKAKC